ncbi:MAG: NdvB protein [Gammaproteobacteria bacterium]
MNRRLVSFQQGGERVNLSCPKSLPKAGGFLWNSRMLLQVTCRGYATAQYMEPEPRKYAHAPTLEARTFFQPESPFYAHHPGRYCYVRDEQDQTLFSAPHEPVRARPAAFQFSVGRDDIYWRVVNHGIGLSMRVALPAHDIAELWELCVENTSDRRRELSIYPCFSIGYMSWMNQSACYRKDLGGILASSITPYQKLDDYPTIKDLKDSTYLIHDQAPDAFETSREAFEGEGGIHRPDGVTAALLGNGDAAYETPIAALQYRVALEPGESRRFRFVFGPARGDDDVSTARETFLGPEGFEQAAHEYAAAQSNGRGRVQVSTPDSGLDSFVNHWLPRQVYYIARANRMTTDPQTRNFLQDHMGCVYLQPEAARDALLLALAQQNADGRMPEGILLNGSSHLKYINQVPHNDHCVWLPITLRAYLDETGDWDLLHQLVTGREDQSAQTVIERVTAAMRWQLSVRDHRDLSLIAQGDWCDPMNMVGHKGRGVSGWLSMASVHAAREWAAICAQVGLVDVQSEMLREAEKLAAAIRAYLWDGNWFARGITDDNVVFGVSTDREGRIFLNAQSWALLADVADAQQRERLLSAVDEQLNTKYGAMMLAPAYTTMREDIGRITQKHPGSAENGAIYNHAAMFYAYALYRLGESERAFEALFRAIPGPDDADLIQRGQLPVFIPNYYRGAVHQIPKPAGRSSQLCHTAASSWFYRIVIEQLFGLRGRLGGLLVQPQLPKAWSSAKIERQFRGATFNVHCRRTPDVKSVTVAVDGVALKDNLIRSIEAGRQYRVDVSLPVE